MRKSSKTTVNEEVSFPSDAELVSTTDTRGVITYANKEFCEVAGYTSEELVGKNHNVVRHPHMPKAAFKDLWDHLKQGQAWRGAVKNRCKDGRYYWVDAFVTPIYEAGTLVGYQSVRTKLGETEKRRAINLYKKAIAAESLKVSKVDIFNIHLSFSRKLALWIVLNLALIIASITYSPYLSVLFPLASVMLFYNTGTRESYDNKLADEYDSISRQVFCETKNNISEYHLKMFEGRLRTILGRVLDSSRFLLGEAEVLSRTSEEARENVEKESVELEKVATAVEEMVATISEIALHCSDIMNQTNLARNTSKQVTGDLSSTQKKIEHLAAEVEASAKITDELAKESVRINSVMEEIQGIAEQTNLLALNASIEAARAGEHGRGFAVVADEVRALSQRTHGATEQIQKSVTGIQSTLKTLSASMDEGQKSADECVEITNVTKDSLSGLCSIVTEISDNTTQIASAAEQQSVAAKEIGGNISNLSQSSTQSLCQAELVAKNADEIGKQSEKLLFMTKSFG
ncbi:methyl-accepting chemotaxis protein [Vibrio sp. JC009]|uniref:methyl-accepting chemotaxis protein n=1 Tax=Vibrio sp. JC009 TaxID=2912314 RepID=UPI0023B1F014|nr:PAS domain-containing methyl-accepting chemotaxis protein [Vibrio sp. JC009]WED22964.1 methyl-accepting chemotaxis protein [Vibrio sp. JC009]